MKALVLGADGFMGKKMCQFLVSQGIEVRAFDISEMKELRNIEGIECIQGDFQMISTMPDVFYDVTQVYHFACSAIPNEITKRIPQELEINLIPLTNMLELMHEKKIEKFVFLSSAGTVYGEGEEIHGIDDILKPICSYGTLKVVSEAYIQLYNRMYGHSYKIARVSNPYGVGQSRYKTQGIIPIFINALQNDKEITVFGNGENIRDYIYIDDVIEALYRICTCAEEDDDVFNIASGETFSINQIITIIEDELDKKFSKINYVAPRICDVECNKVDNTLIINKMGWKPQYRLREGIQRTYNLMR